MSSCRPFLGKAQASGSSNLDTDGVGARSIALVLQALFDILARETLRLAPRVECSSAPNEAGTDLIIQVAVCLSQRHTLSSHMGVSRNQNAPI